MRWKLFDWIVRPWVPEGRILPWWAVAIRWALFPLDSAYWTMSRARGYQLLNDVWVINGIHYTGAAMRALADADGETYRITRAGGTVMLERVHTECSYNRAGFLCDCDVLMKHPEVVSKDVFFGSGGRVIRNLEGDEQ